MSSSFFNHLFFFAVKVGKREDDKAYWCQETVPYVEVVFSESRETAISITFPTNAVSFLKSVPTMKI